MIDLGSNTQKWFGIALAWCFAWLSAAAGSEQPHRFDGYKIVRVQVQSDDQLATLERQSTTILNCVPGVGPMDALVSPDQLKAVRGLGLSVNVVQDDVEALLDDERAASAVASADPFEDFFLAYHPYGGFSESGTILWYMDQLVSRYPALASLVNIGLTVEGRDIWGLRITNDAIADKPAVVYLGCEHAREWITTTVPTYFATVLLENYGIDATVTELVDRVEFFLIPVFNVDGYIYSRTTYRYWRKNRRFIGGSTYGVDLNRNWGEGWGGPGSSPSATSETYRGLSPFSEPETQALRDFFLAHPNVRAQLDIHAYGQDILWPYGYTLALPSDQEIFMEIGQAMRSLISEVHGKDYDGIGPVYSTLYAASGISVDWTYAELDIFSYTFECRDQGAYGFNLPANQIIVNNEELFPAMMHLTNSDWVRAPLRFEFPTSIPSALTAGQETILTLNVVPLYGSVEPGTVKLHYRFHSDDPFIESPLIAVSGGSYQAMLPATNCGSAPQFYFSAETAEGVVVTDPRGAPAKDFYTAEMAPGSTLLLWEDLNLDPGWTTDGLWERGEPTGAIADIGGPDPTEGYTGRNVYGYNLSGDYTNNMPEQHLTSPPIDCTGKLDVSLQFMRWLGVDVPPYDRALVQVSTDGLNWTTVWENAGLVSDTSWTGQTIDISEIADDQPTVYLRWTMGPTDEVWTACGWNIDDIQLHTTSCHSPPGDYDGDGNVDMRDIQQMWRCLSGSLGTPPPTCRTFDLDGDGQVDVADWAGISGSWTGPRSQPEVAP